MRLPEFQRFQYAFTAHIRDPKAHPRPAGIDARRMKIYRDLLYNNTESFLLSCFPVLRRVLGKQKWTSLVRAFFAVHRSHTPYFRQIPDEFIQYLQTEWVAPSDFPAFVLELAHYEWIELVLSVSTRALDVDVDPAGDLLEQCPVLNPVLASLHYHWPVQRIRPRARIAPAETYLLVFRDGDDRIQFIEMNAFTARLVHLLRSGTCSGRTALEAVAAESRHPAPEHVLRGGLATMRDLQARGALLGVVAAG